jgi:UDP-N-acetyl-D-mannosaminuronate dehydrogenase
MKFNYPRNNDLKSPGLVGGTCLRKDWGFINESFPQTDLILQAYKINEYMPKFYTSLIELKNKRVGILGYTMKQDVDDTRDSLVPKMIRYIEKEVPSEIYISEPNLPLGKNEDKENNYIFDNKTIEEVLNKSNIIFIAINHSEFKKVFNRQAIFKNKIIIDPWGLLNCKLINIF